MEGGRPPSMTQTPALVMYRKDINTWGKSPCKYKFYALSAIHDPFICIMIIFGATGSYFSEKITTLDISNDDNQKTSLTPPRNKLTPPKCHECNLSHKMHVQLQILRNVGLKILKFHQIWHVYVDPGHGSGQSTSRTETLLLLELMNGTNLNMSFHPNMDVTNRGSFCIPSAH